MKPTRQDIIEDLQNRVWKGRIATIDDLKLEISRVGYDGEEPIEEIDDVLSPMGWNICDRCGALGDGELDFLWLDYADLNEEDDKTLLDAIAKEKVDYCALCRECVKELRGEK